MTGELIINGKDAYTEWGVRMGDGFLDALDGFLPLKALVENESRLEHGKHVDTGNAMVDSREVTLTFTIEGQDEAQFRTRRKAFQTELLKGKVEVQVPALGGEVYRLVYTGKSLTYALAHDRAFCKVASKFTEPNPMDRDAEQD